ncbi:hypothetical protein [Bifidobacterium dolichotidis]|nr:hypothetical protein [Bifidobacterium dolichotidis]
MKSVRIGLVVLGGLWLVFAALLTDQFMQGVFDADWLRPFLMNLYLMNSVLFVLLGFLLVKVTFAKADGAAKLLHHLPITGKMRSATLLACEFTVVSICVFIGLLAFLFTMIRQGGIAAVSTAIAQIIIPSVVAYSLLYFVWNCIARIMALLRLSRYTGMVGTIVIAMMSFAFYSSTFAMTMQIQKHWTERSTTWSVLSLFSDLSLRFGNGVSVLAGAVCASTLLIISLVIAPKQFSAQSVYVACPIPWVSKSDLALFAAYIIRSKDMLMSVALCAVCVVGAVFTGHSEAALYATVLFSFAGLSQFANGICIPWQRHQSSCAYTYVCMIGSQIIVATLAWIAVTVVLLPWGGCSMMTYACSYGALLTAIMSCTMVGIIFPMARDNPANALLGLAAMLLVAIVAVSMVSLLQLPTWALIAAGAVMVSAIVVYSISGITTYRKGIRNA